MPRKYNTSRISGSRNYTVAELAELLDVTQVTVRRWIKDGLPAIKDQIPWLILGKEVKPFLKPCGASRKLLPGEFHCCSCKQSRRCANEFAMVRHLNAKHIVLIGNCSVCGETMVVLSSPATLALRASGITLVEQGQVHISETVSPSLNVH